MKKRLQRLVSVLCMLALAESVLVYHGEWSAFSVHLEGVAVDRPCVVRRGAG